MTTTPCKGKGIIFDLDGTLLNSLADLADAGNYALEKHGFAPVPPEEFRYYVGNGMRKMIRLALAASLKVEPCGAQADEALVAAMLETAATYYMSNWHNKTKPYPGIAELILDLTGRGTPIGVCSNKNDSFVKQMVRRYFPDAPFLGVLGERPETPLKPDPAGALHLAARMGLPPEEVLFVGDTRVDMQTARNAGMQPLGVSWGFRPVEELLEHGAGLVVDEPGAILSCVSRAG